MNEEEYEECCVRHWCVDHSIRINRFGTVERIINDARVLHRFVRGKADGALVDINDKRKGK